MNRLVDLFINYLQYERNYSIHTVDSYCLDLNQFEEFLKLELEENYYIEKIDSDIIRCWIAKLLDEGYNPTSINRKLSTLKSFFKFLTKKNITTSNPVKLIVAPKTKKKLPIFIRDKEIEALLDKKGAQTFEELRDRLIIEVLYNTGIRRSELIGIKNSDIDFDSKLIKINGKRNKQRLIPFANGLKNQMLEYTKKRDEAIKNTCIHFFTRDNGEKLQPNDIYYIVGIFLAQIPELKKKSPHVLRHSFATNMLNNGAKLNVVKELLGHSNLSSTSIYTHTTFKELKEIYHAHPRAK